MDHFARYMMGKCRHVVFGEQNIIRGTEQNDYMTSEGQRRREKKNTLVTIHFPVPSFGPDSQALPHIIEMIPVYVNEWILLSLYHRNNHA